MANIHQEERFMILYKYRADSEYTEKIFNDKKIWLSLPDDLNDPFECSIQNVMEDIIDKIVQKEKSEQLEGLVFTYSISPEGKKLWGLPKHKIKKLMYQIGLAKSFDMKYEIYRRFIYERTGNYPSDPNTKYQHIKQKIKRVGIFSLSENVDNELMWGHYSDGGRGVAIGFSVNPDSKLSRKSNCIKVNYNNDNIVLYERLKTSLVFGYDENLALFYQNISFDDPFFLSVISTKTEAWSYESEWRYVEEASGLFDLPAPIAEIVFGLKCPQSVRTKYINLIKKNFENNIEFYEIINIGKRLVKIKME